MAILRIRHYPDPVLLKKAAPVTQFDDALLTLIEDMWETMYDAQGVGLAAPQIGVSLQLSVIDISEDKSNRLIIINPELSELEDFEDMQEGCLSLPGVYENVKRARRIHLRAQNEKGEVFEMHAEGLLAEAIQHETDHLHGTLLLNRISSLRRSRAIKALEKTLREENEK